MFSVIGKIVAILFMVTIGLVVLTFGFGWLTAVLWPLMLVALPIALVAWIVYKVVRA